jgi:hypothetical protein
MALDWSLWIPGREKVSKQQVAKLRARAEHLLDLFIALRERFAVLRPLAFDEELTERVGGGPPARGRFILQNALLQHCIVDVVKVSVDTSERSPSAANIMSVLAQEEIRQWLRKDFSTVPPPINVGDDPLTPGELEEILEGERDELRAKFDQTWERLSERWMGLERDVRLDRFKSWRDKLIAHSDLHRLDGEYRLTDLSKLGLKWGDLGDLIAELQEVVSDIQALTRSAGFAWEMLDEQLEAAATGFWSKLG